jgi:hypothetical protein
MATVDAISTGGVATVAVIVTIALVGIGVLLSIVIKKTAGRITVMVVVVGLTALVWVERVKVDDEFHSPCSENVTFFGIHVDRPDWVGGSYCGP